MQGKRRLRVLAGSIFVLLLSFVAVLGMLQPTTAVKAAGSLYYHGVDHMGSEYRCLTSGAGTFDGPTDQNSINVMKTWNINIVRVPLNEDCWLGINGEPSGMSATQYRQDIINYCESAQQQWYEGHCGAALERARVTEGDGTTAHA